MKCIAKDFPTHRLIDRLPNAEAAHLVADGWHYTTRAVWKRYVRDVKRAGAKPPETQAKPRPHMAAAHAATEAAFRRV